MSLTDSWVEVSSQPSSSSLSSAADEIITTGLRVQHDSNLHRRRRRRTTGGLELGRGIRAPSAGGSSQDEYDESESESDRVMTSSNEGLRPSPLHQELRRSSQRFYSSASSDNGGDEDDADENSTAVNYPRTTEVCFTPQPTAFSHPPTAQAQSDRHSSEGYFATQRPALRSSSQRHSYPSQPQHSPYNIISPSHQADHDAALRASLSTLLSCAAAARGLPKSNRVQSARTSAVPSSRVDPTTLRMVPESVALGLEPESASRQPSSASPSLPSSNSPPTSPAATDKSKRKASTTSTTGSPQTRSSSKERRAVKKARRTAMEEISPTLLTWVVSAGVVVLVSALSFSAGYVVGREAGKAEVVGHLGSAGAEAGRCGKEVANEMGRAGSLGLKRLRWSGATGVRV